MKLCWIVVGCLFFTECTEMVSCETNADCNESEICIIHDGVLTPSYCQKQEVNYYQVNNSNQNISRSLLGKDLFKGSFEKVNSSDTYCYKDDSLGNHCQCDVLVYQDGHNETVNCWCWSDLLVHYRCINLTRENATLLRGVPI
jgi:hypothetical protein